MNQSIAPTVILGAGFTGLFTALHLCHQRYPHSVILIDQKEQFVFKPLLYEFLSGEMNTNQVLPRYEELLDCSGVAFVQDTVQEIDLQQRQIKLASGLSYQYSNLVLALGSAISYFGIKGAKENSIAFRSGEDAMALSHHLRQCLQLASQTPDPQRRRTLLTVAVIGAGPAGVEMAATLADLLPIWYDRLDGNLKEIRVVILNRSKEILKGDVNSHLRTTAQAALQQRTVPVELILEAAVSAIYPARVEYKRHEQIEVLEAGTIIWTGGNMAHPLIKNLSIPDKHRDRQARLRATPTLQLPDFPEVFAGGDCVVVGKEPLPATAQVAYQQGAIIARNLQAIAEGNDASPGHVTLRGTLMKLGLGESVANIADRFEITGRLGHLLRQGTYLELLPTPVRNFRVTTDWIADEIFQKNNRPRLMSRMPKPTARMFQWAGGAVAAVVLASSGLLIWRVTQPEQFNRVWSTAPTSIERLPSKSK